MKKIIVMIFVVVLALTVTNSYSFEQSFTWDPCTNIDGYRVYRQIEDENYEEVWEGTGIEATISGFEENVFYRLVVRAYNEFRESPDSNVLTFIRETYPAPVSNAGTDQTINQEQETVQLDGSSSTGIELGYSWDEDVTNPFFVSLSDWYASNPTFEIPSVSEQTELIFHLIVTDQSSFEDIDSVTITILPPEEEAGIPGDINGDGIKDGADKIIILRHRGHPVEECPLCDINGDGAINNTDVILWYRL